MPLLQDWEREFQKLDGCPWAGPRPLSKKDEDERRFLGREGDTTAFANKVDASSLVFLTGESGVGKSSLLNVKLIRELKELGRVPFVCSDWTMTESEESDIDFIVRSKMCPDSVSSGRGKGSATRFCDDLDREYAGLAVIIFDQFEELIRHQRALFDKVVDWIVTAHKRNQTHIVISLRLEYLHRLSQIEHRASPWHLDSHILQPITDTATIEKIIRSKEGDTDGAITSEAASKLMGFWNEAVGQSSSAWNDIGLLHLQGTLYALHARALEEQKTQIDTAIVESLAKIALIEPTDGATLCGPTVFHVGLREAVRYKMKRCRAACTKVQLDQVFVEGTRSVVRRLVPHLSSGGFKLEREEWELARVALSRELDRLNVGDAHAADRPGPSTSDAEKIFRALVARSHTADGASETAVPEPNLPDLLQVSRAQLVATDQELSRVCPPPGAVSERERANGVDSPPWTADPHDLSAGPLLGLRPVEVLIEELRRAAFAVKWLKTAGLVRAGAGAHGVTMLSLVHDGLAAALEHLSRLAQSGPRDALFLLSAARGETFHWHSLMDPERPCEEFDGSRKPVTITNLRWRDCQVSAAFHRVVFVNCDFRGTRFRECRFRGVVFVNCLLDDVSFEECAILGSPEPSSFEPPQKAVGSPNRLWIDNGRLPSFSVEVGPATVAELRRYRAFKGCADEDAHCALEPDQGGLTSQESSLDPRVGSYLYSRTSGLPAVPWEPRFGEVLPWRREIGGLTMYGGRLSSLMIRRCRFDEDGGLSLRHIAGSALDVVEQAEGGTIDIVGSSVRGFTVTRSVDDRLEDAPERRMAITVFYSVMTNVWFGRKLHGEIVFNDCLVSQLCNLSDCAQLKVSVKNSRYYGLVNVSSADGMRLEEGDLLGSNAKSPKVREEELTRMDYRSKPARLELES